MKIHLILVYGPITKKNWNKKLIKELEIKAKTKKEAIEIVRKKYPKNKYTLYYDGCIINVEYA